MKKYTGPRVDTVVDVAIFNQRNTKTLLCRKKGQMLWQFVGGFASVDSPTFEYDVLREVKEECGIGVGNIKYIGSCIIDDERYRNTKNKMKSLFFKIKHFNGVPKAADDVEEVQWVGVDILDTTILVPKHHPLFSMLMFNMADL
jgi:ADP-ribose pyrophosphatase YjhB (NUDIX family)